MREAVGPDVPVSIKMNSADFQRGGFDEDDSLQVMTWLQEAGVDLIEVSGGTYEAPAMTGAKRSTREREGYFLDFVARAKDTLTVPLCITGGFRTPAGMEGALNGGASMVGLARSLCVQPELARDVLAGKPVESKVRRLSTGVRAIDRAAMLDVLWYEAQLARMGEGRDPDPDLGEWRSLLGTVRRAGLQAFRMRRA
jgi:2,4-dienoyl-CoA reductase-like NADH-dependent reductase (Old Yellow Enzyme family)